MLIAICCGRVIYDINANMLYRIHSENLVGLTDISLLARLDKLKRYFIKRDDANQRLITATELLRLFPMVAEDKKRILKLYASYQDSWKNKIDLAFNKEIRANCAENPNVFTVKVLTSFV